MDGPVVVLRQTEPAVTHRDVVVEVGDADDSAPAVELASRAAALRDLPRTASHGVKGLLSWGRQQPHRR